MSIIKFQILSRINCGICEVLSLKLIIIVLLLIFGSTVSLSQENSYPCVQNLLENISKMPGLEQEISLSVTQLPLKEFIRTLANIANLNVSIDPTLDMRITNNFAEVTAGDILIFLCKEYNLSFEFSGNILSIAKSVPEIVNNYDSIIRSRIIYDHTKGLLSLDLRSDSLSYITKEITQQTGVNIILTPDIQGELASVFIQQLPIESCLKKLAQANNFKFRKDEEAYILGKEAVNSSTVNSNISNGGKSSSNGTLDYEIYNADNISIYAYNAPISEVLTKVSKANNVNFFIYSELIGQVSINLNHSTYDEFVEKVLKGTKYTFKKENGIYLVGDRQLENLRCTRIIQLVNRSLTDILKVLPANLQQGVEIYEFKDLNSIIVSGSEPAVNDLQNVINELDKTVPVILIEVVIIDSKSNFSVSTGIQAGVGEAPVKSGGELFPTIDYTLSSESINKLLSSFEGFGWFNLGKVTPNFYLTIKAMEENGTVKIRSTPKLSTLNGHEATLTIGNTEYYLEETNSVIGTQNPQNITTQIYKPVQVNFMLQNKSYYIWK